MNRLLLLLLLPGPVFAATVNPSMTTAQIQAALNSAPAGSTVSFAAGNYSIQNPLQMPCTGLQLTGPAVTPASVILSAQSQQSAILDYPANCSNLGSVKYLGFSGAGLYFAIGSNGNFTIQNSQVTNLSSAALFFDGYLGTTLSNIVIDHNTFGDSKSCASQFNLPNAQNPGTDPGGYCAGVITSQGVVNGITISNNVFEHLEEGIHFNQMANWNPGAQGSVCISCVITGNYIHNYHRIGIEIQTGTPTNPVMVTHNAVVDPLNSFFGTFAVSLACCQWNQTMGSNGTSPGLIFDDNVLIASVCGMACPPYGVEFWGNGSQGTNSLIEGTFSNGYTWGYGAGSWAINNNTICGPNYLTQGGYITNQQGQSNPPQMSGNVTGTTCGAKPSATPTISPSSGTFSGSQSVAIAMATVNTSIWYTTDGSMPAPGTAKLYTAPFPISSTTTVKAIGMWGNQNQPTSYPSGYGYAPSPVVSATYTLAAQCQQVTMYPNGSYKSVMVQCN